MTAVTMLRNFCFLFMFSLSSLGLFSDLQGLPPFFGGNHSDVVWKKLVSTHFHVFYEQNYLKEAQYTLEQLERYLPGLSEEFGIEVHDKIEVILFAKNGVSGFADPVTNKLEIQTDGKCTKHLIIHELTHHLMYRNFDQIFGVVQRLFHLIPLPVWFVEGLAEFMADSHGPYLQNRYLSSMVLNNTFPSFDRMHDLFDNSTWQTSGYILGQEMVKFVMEKMRREPLRILKLLSAFRDATLSYNFLWAFDKVLQDFIKIDSRQLFEELKVRLKKKFGAELKDRERLKEKVKRLPLPGYNIPTPFQALAKNRYAYMDLANDRGFYTVSVAKLIQDQLVVQKKIMIPFRLSSLRFAVDQTGNQILLMEREWDIHKNKQTVIWEVNLETGVFSREAVLKYNVRRVFYGQGQLVMQVDLEGYQAIATYDTKSKKIKSIKKIEGPNRLELQDVSKNYGSILYTVENDQFERQLFLFQRGQDKILKNFPQGLYPTDVRFIDEENFIGVVFPDRISNLFSYSTHLSEFKLHSNFSDSFVILEYDQAVHRLFLSWFTHPYWRPVYLDFNYVDAKRYALAESQQASEKWELPVGIRQKDKLNRTFKFKNAMYREYPESRFKHLFTFPMLGSDERGDTIGVVSVPIIDTFEHHLVQANMEVGLYSGRPSYGLTYFNNQFLPSLTFKIADGVFYNGYISNQYSYLQQTLARASSSLYFPMFYSTVSFAKEATTFKRLKGPFVATGNRSLNTLALSYAKTKAFGRYGAAVSYAITDTLFNGEFNYQRFFESAWVLIDLPWYEQFLNISFDHAVTFGQKMLNAPEIYSTFRGLQHTNEPGYNNLVFSMPISGTVPAINSRQGNQKFVAKVTYDFPVVSDLDKKLAIFYLEALNASSFVYLGNAWFGNQLELNDFKLIGGVNLSLTVKNKGVTFAPGLGISLDLVQYEPSFYLAFSYSELW